MHVSGGEDVSALRRLIQNYLPKPSHLQLSHMATTTASVAPANKAGGNSNTAFNDKACKLPLFYEMILERKRVHRVNPWKYGYPI